MLVAVEYVTDGVYGDPLSPLIVPARTAVEVLNVNPGGKEPVDDHELDAQAPLAVSVWLMT